jgi:hypothetical protein
VRDVTQRDQKIFFEAGRQDLWRASVHWSENPREWTDHASQLHANSAPGVFTLEDSFQAAVRAAPASVDADADQEWDPGTKGFLVKNAIAQQAQPVLVGHQRKMGGAAFQLTPGQSWVFSLAADRERRSGTATQTLAMYFSLPRGGGAADLKTDDLVGAAEFRGRD